MVSGNREGGSMARKRYTAEEIIGDLRTIELETGKGLGVSASGNLNVGLTAGGW